MEAGKNTINKKIGDFRTYFLYAFIFGVIVNSQALFFNTDATDSLRAYGGTGAEIGSGRFIGHLLDILFENLGFYQPFRFINVLIFLALSAVAATLIVMIFRIRDRLLGVIICFIIMSSAETSGILAYYYVAHMYGFSFVLSIMSCYLILKRKGIILPAFLIAVSLGIYQAFLPTVILVIFLYQFLELSCHPEGHVEEGDAAAPDSFKEAHDLATVWFINTIRFSLIVIAGLVIYVLSNRIYLVLSGESISGYMNMGSNVLPDLGLSSTVSFGIRSYQFLFSLPFSQEYFISDNLIIRISLLCSLLVLMLEFLYFIQRQRKHTMRVFILLVLCLALPLIINLPMLIMDEVGERVSLNWYFVFIIPLIFYEYVDEKFLKHYLKRFSMAIYILLTICACITIGYDCYRNQNIYQSYIKVHETASYIVHDLEQRLADNGDFSLEDEIIFVGRLDTESLNKNFFNVEYDEFLYNVFNRDHNSIFKRYALKNYNFIIPGDSRIKEYSIDEFRVVSQDELEDYDYFCINGVHNGLPTIHSTKDEIEAMPSYPDAGCVRKIDGIMVIKLGQ